MKRIYTDRIKEHKEALNRLLHSSIVTVKTISNRESFTGVYILSRPDTGIVFMQGNLKVSQTG